MNEGVTGYHQASVYFTDQFHVIVRYVTISNNDRTNNPFHITSYL